MPPRILIRELLFFLEKLCSTICSVLVDGSVFSKKDQSSCTLLCWVTRLCEFAKRMRKNSKLNKSSLFVSNWCCCYCYRNATSNENVSAFLSVSNNPILFLCLTILTGSQYSRITNCKNLNWTNSDIKVFTPGPLSPQIINHIFLRHNYKWLPEASVTHASRGDCEKLCGSCDFNVVAIWEWERWIGAVTLTVEPVSQWCLVKDFAYLE